MATISRQGAIGALLDEYERAIADLKKVIDPVTNDELVIIVDAKTGDENCRSVQTILTHVVHSGYGYATSIHNREGYQMTRPAKVFHQHISNYERDLDDMFVFTEKIFREVEENEVEQLDDALKIKTGWGQVYDIEQLMEHAIVHILRHRRQIERFKILLKKRSAR